MVSRHESVLGPLGAESKTVAQEIALAIEARELPADPSYAGGTAGLAIFHAVYSKSEDSLDRAERALDHAYDAAEQTPLGPSLATGFLGIGVATEFLRGDLFDADSDPNAATDEAVLSALASGTGGGLGLFHGIAGAGLYGLERFRNGADSSLLTAVVRAAERLSFDPREVGVTDGATAAISVLASIGAAGIETAQARALADSLAITLLDQELPSRSVWCIGDLGISAVLVSASQEMGGATWQGDAATLARQAAQRAVSPDSDPALTYGAAGAMLCFCRLAQRTGETLFADAAQQWARELLRMRSPTGGIAGYRSYDGKSDPPWRDEPGLFFGATGIALALLTAAGELSPEWSRLLLL